MQAESQNSQSRLLQLEPAEIDCSGPWLFRCQEPEADLLLSLQELGQLEPILVRQGEQAWELVSGYKRCRALQQLGVLVLAREVQGQEIQLGLVGLQANLGPGLGLDRILEACRYFQVRIQEEELQVFLKRWIRPLLGRQDWPLLLLWLGLPLEYDQFLLQKRLPLEAASRLQMLDTAALNDLRPLFQALSWSGNQIRNLLDWLLEAAGMQAKSAGQLLAELDLQRILAQGLSPKDTKQRILDRLKSMRFPWLQSLESEFAELCHQFKPKYWRIQPEKNFETDALYLQARIQSAGDLLPAVKELQGIQDNEVWSRLEQWQTQRFYPK